MSAFKAPTVQFICLVLAAIPSGAVSAQGAHPPFGRLLDWRTEQIDQVVTYGGAGQRVSVDGKECLTGGSLYFRVNDEYAFDMDETVWLDVELSVASADTKVSVSYDRNDTGREVVVRGADAVKPLQLSERPTSHWHRLRIPLERARLANLGFEGSDFHIFADGSVKQAFYTPSARDARPPRQFTICHLSLRRSYTTPVRTVVGWTAIEVVDEHGRPTPARLGLYDPAGRLPLPSNEAVTLNNSLTGATRVIGLGGVSQDLPPWPVQNRSVFYTDGRYHTRLPVGDYDLIVAKGPEYRLARHRFTVRANATTALKVKLRRWTDMAAKGWYSGDGHIHYTRNSAQDDHTLLLFTRAEDLNVGNILQVDNSAKTRYAHYDWRPVVPDREAPFVLVPGQEAPRTTRLGHTLELNIKGPIRDTAHYLLYHKVFEQVRAQGGVAGYAHAVGPGFDSLTFEARGLAIDVPFGLVDFAEITTLYITGPSVWFDFLNLGYKLSPTAGSDYPWGGVPGTVRNYVHLNQPFTPQAWFDALKQGRTFVTSGPMLDVSVNGQGVGSEIHVKSGEPLVIQATAAMNPDLDALASLELIEQGDPIKSVSSQRGAPELELRHALPAQHGTWFVVRARGKHPQVIALSAPIYVVVDGQRFWKRSAVPAIVAKLKRQMQEILTSNHLETTEAWEAREPFAKYWAAQHGALQDRIEQANAIYDDLVRRATTSAERP